jgi:hypothetical protein
MTIFLEWLDKHWLFENALGFAIVLYVVGKA